MSSFSNHLIRWHKKYGRKNLPWQQNKTAYRVWISEIMLQQTQVATVIPYFERFMQKFPTIAALAQASENDVLAHWSGLGYYARARNIHKTAKIIHTQFHGHFPETVDVLAQLPGIGQSTAGAIVSFSQQKKAVILDGNVKRVLARYRTIATPINDKNTLQQLWQYAEQFTPKKNVHHYNQAIMDLGAIICTRTKPNCTACPVKQSCQAYQHNTVAQYPKKINKKPRPVKKIHVLLIYNAQRNQILLMKRPSKGIWGGLWSLPESDTPTPKKFLTLSLRHIDTLETITHQFTHFTIEIIPVCFTAAKSRALDSDKIIWYKLSTPWPGGIAAPIAKIIQRLT